MSIAGTSESASLSPLFRLPQELRDLIYEQVFADLISNPLYIHRFFANPQWRVCYNPDTRVPGLLLTSKAIYSESKSCLYSSCNPPRIVIDDQWAVHRGFGAIPEEFEWLCGFAPRDLETIIPMLTTVEELTLDIKALGPSQPYLLLVRWIRAVLNARETPLRTASISLRVGLKRRLYHVHHFEEVFEEAARVHSRNRPFEEIWVERRVRSNQWAGPSRGYAWARRHAIQAEVPDSLSCSVAWRDLMQAEL